MKRRGFGPAAYGLAVFLQLGPSLAANLFASGEQAQALCASSTEWCVGFVTGALDGWSALEAYYSGEKFCVPGDLTTGQVADIFARHLGQQPTRLEEPASYLLYEKLIEQFPCAGAATN